MSPELSEYPMNRRQFLSMSAATVAALSIPSISFGVSNPRKLSFYHTHTRQKLDVCYGSSECYEQGALEKIDHFLRDFRTGEEYPIDLKLLDLLSSIREKLGGHGTFEVISGFRSSKTNQQLRNKSSDVAKKSLHMVGKAIDIRMTGVPIRKVQICALDMKYGGVGFYGKSNFIHLDTGRVRYW